MIIKHCNKKTIFPCAMNPGNSLRIVITPDPNVFNVVSCCLYDFNEDHKLGIITADDINNNKVYEKLTKIRNNNHNIIPIIDGCFVGNNFDIKNKNEYYCNWNGKPFDTVEVCTTKTCNLACSMCRSEIINEKYHDELYYKILYQLKNHNLDTIWLTEQGEPFFHKAKCLEYLGSLTLNDVKTVEIISNLTLLNDDDIEYLHNIELQNKIKISIHASIDGISEETYKKIRKNNLFNKVMHNAEKLAEYKILRIVNFVVQPDNIHELLLANEYFSNILHVFFNVIPLNLNNDMSLILNNEIYRNFLKTRNL